MSYLSYENVIPRGLTDDYTHSYWTVESFDGSDIAWPVSGDDIALYRAGVTRA